MAVQGNADAKYYLGEMFKECRDTLQISKNADMWFNVTSLNGSEAAYRKRNKLANTMSPSAIEEAQGMALKCIQIFYRDCGLTIQPTPEKAATKEKIIPKKVTTTSSELRSYFISQNYF